MVVQNRIEEFLKDSMSYMKNKKQNADDGAGELRIGTPLKLELDMYALLYITSLYSEYIYVIDKKHRESQLDEGDREWIAKLRRKYREKGAISEETAKKLLCEKKALEAKI